MICRKQPPFKIPEPIENIWEVVLDQNTWAQIVQRAINKKQTYSSVVRSCVFKLIKSRNFLSITMENRSKISKVSRENGHRHQLCLYGTDEKLIRLAAYDAAISVATLIRVALFKYLENLSHLSNHKFTKLQIAYTKIPEFFFIEFKHYLNSS